MRYILPIILFIYCIGCDSPTVAYFKEPQPTGDKKMDAFPLLLQGLYSDKEQALFLEIDDKKLTRYYEFDMQLHKDSLGEDMVLKGDTLIDISTGEAFNIQRRNDSIFHHYRSETDTLFMIDEDHVLKKYKGHYFLNAAEDNGGWSVRRLSLRKGVLTMGSITDSTDLAKLQVLTGSTADTTPHQFSLTRKQFKKFVRDEGFGDIDSFYRVRSKY